MNVQKYLKRLQGSRKPVWRPRQNRPRVEELEGRLVLSTLAFTFNNAVYTGGSTPGDSLTVSEQSSGSIVERIFTDPVETITAGNTNPFFHARFTGSGTHTVTWFVNPGVGNLAIHMQSLGDVVNLQSIDVPTSISDPPLGGVINIGNSSNGIQGIRSQVTVLPQGTLGGAVTSVNVNDAADSSSYHWTISNTGLNWGIGTLSGLFGVNYSQPSIGALDVNITGSNVSPTNSANIYNVTNTVTAGGFDFGSETTLNLGTDLNEVIVQGTAGPLTIQGNGGNDSVSIGTNQGVSSTVANILGSVTVRDTAPKMTLGIVDFGDTTSHTAVTLSSTALTGLAPASINYQASGLLDTPTGNPGLFVNTGQAPDTITVTNLPTYTNITAGNLSGTNLVNVQGITGDLLLDSPPSGNPGETGTLKVIVGSSSTGVDGTLSDINGAVDLPEVSNTNLIVDDSGDTTPRTVTIGDSQGPVSDLTGITGLAPTASIFFGTSNVSDNSTLTINGGRGGDTFNIASTNVQVTNTTINGQGNDTFNVTTTQSPLTISTGGGANHVNIQGIAIDHVVSGPAPILSVVGHGGNDTVTVGSRAPALGGTLANLFAQVVVSNTTKTTALLVDDSGDTVPRFVTVALDQIQFSGIGAPVTFLGGVKSVGVFGGTSDTFAVTLIQPIAPVTLHGGSGTNTLLSGAFINRWVITGTNSGTLQGTVAFQNVQNLRDPVSSLFTTNDTFVFDNGAGVTGSIVGGGGPGSVTVLDYSQYKTPVFVDLKTHTATGAAAGVSNIENVLGGSGNNILVGNGSNFLEGGSGRDILISGGGNSTLLAGPGQAILIGAHYLDDLSVTALHALLAEWSRTDLGSPSDPTGYLARINHLEHGGGLNGGFLLNSSTVVPQAGSTRLVTGAALDFLFLDFGDILANPLRPGEVSVFV